MALPEAVTSRKGVYASRDYALAFVGSCYRLSIFRQADVRRPDTNDTRLLTRGQRPSGCLLNNNQTTKVPSSEIFTADYPVTSASQMVGQGAILGMLRSDGIDDGYNVIQGVRSYDPSAGTWTSPDAYAGEVHDPMSYDDPNGTRYFRYLTLFSRPWLTS